VYVGDGVTARMLTYAFDVSHAEEFDQFIMALRASVRESTFIELVDSPTVCGCATMDDDDALHACTCGLSYCDWCIKRRGKRKS